MNQEENELEKTTDAYENDNNTTKEDNNSDGKKIEGKVEKIGCVPFIIGGMSFIPLIGVVFGVITIVLGLVYLNKRGWRLIVLGLSGILFTVVLYGSLYYFGFVQRGGVYDELRTNMAKDMMPKIITEIEYFKLQNGRYPLSLSELTEKSSDKFLFIVDPIDMRPSGNGPRQFYYELIDDGKNYYLFSSGDDGVPFSEDDILPDMSEENISKIGYKVRQVK